VRQSRGPLGTPVALQGATPIRKAAMSQMRPQPDPLVDISQATAAFYRQVVETLQHSGVPILIGGTCAYAHYTGIRRSTKDLDLFVRQGDWDWIQQVLRNAGYSTELCFPHWLGKVRYRDAFVDLIFNSGNGISPVDDAWFQHAETAKLLGVSARFVPVEETVWTKAFVMERERYDGADVAHLIRSRARQINWQRLRQLFGPHWRVLLSHLVLFGFVYPAHRSLVPARLMRELTQRLMREVEKPPPETRLCAGTLLSREQYLHDIEHDGYQDSRETSQSAMEPEDVAEWTDAIAGGSES
jgi:Nucleotidyl transferase of unknown function (DUF2204)